MQESHLNQVITSVFGSFQEKAKVVKDMIKLSKSIPEELPAEKRDYMRTPTADELIAMRDYASTLKKKYPKMSKRQIRKDVQETFHIKIFK